MLGVHQQSLAIADHLPLCRLATLLAPLSHQFIGAVELFRLLKVQTMIEVVIFRSGHQFLENFRSIASQGEIFAKTDFFGRRNSDQT
ncbi:MAG: hypothetical protein CMJ90_11190 [Planctomycetes bacterium]|nr:hypothetical protein [Planctomycetota bacterium]